MPSNRKLQVFVSSTYSDLIRERLAAMEAVLGAGHIPAAMEQFNPGDETALEKILRWIDDSDGYMLILGMRYGSIESTSGKSYLEIEYEYALEQKKPFFAMVLSNEGIERHLREHGQRVLEEDNPERYKAFKARVLQHHCGFWNDARDLQAAVFRKLPEWAQRNDLRGWVRGDREATPSMTAELARLSEENRELRTRLAPVDELFEGLTFDALCERLQSITIVEPLTEDERRQLRVEGRLLHALELFGKLFGSPIRYDVQVNKGTRLAELLRTYASMGLVNQEVHSSSAVFTLTDMGRRFRNLLTT